MLDERNGLAQEHAVISRRGNIFLGIKFSGLTDGSNFGAPGKTYLHARVRSARDQALAEELDLEEGPSNVVSFVEKQLALDEAWPKLSFEKVDDHRASLLVGMFIQGTLPADAIPLRPASCKAISSASSRTT